MRRCVPWFLFFLLLAGCTRLDTIPAFPPQTAATWLTIQPHAAIRQRIPASPAQIWGEAV